MQSKRAGPPRPPKTIYFAEAPVVSAESVLGGSDRQSNRTLWNESCSSMLHSVSRASGQRYGPSGAVRDSLRMFASVQQPRDSRPAGGMAEE